MLKNLMNWNLCQENFYIWFDAAPPWAQPDTIMGMSMPWGPDQVSFFIRTKIKAIKYEHVLSCLFQFDLQVM